MNTPEFDRSVIAAHDVQLAQSTAFADSRTAQFEFKYPNKLEQAVERIAPLALCHRPASADFCLLLRLPLMVLPPSVL